MNQMKLIAMFLLGIAIGYSLTLVSAKSNTQQLIKGDRPSTIVTNNVQPKLARDKTLEQNRATDNGMTTNTELISSEATQSSKIAATQNDDQRIIKNQTV